MQVDQIGSSQDQKPRRRNPRRRNDEGANATKPGEKVYQVKKEAAKDVEMKKQEGSGQPEGKPRRGRHHEGKGSYL